MNNIGPISLLFESLNNEDSAPLNFTVCVLSLKYEDDIHTTFYKISTKTE